ncbi:putative ubiquitinyl hydrolase 1 [Helianthus annuus]|nr:putative ubiquitinyl hydrolase 1 [Helianthus annuus]
MAFYSRIFYDSFCARSIVCVLNFVNLQPVIHNIRLPKLSTVGDVLDEIKSKVLSDFATLNLLLSYIHDFYNAFLNRLHYLMKMLNLDFLKYFYHKIYKIFPLTEKIENINDQYWTLRAEEIPEEEKNLGPQDRLIHVYHFTKEAAQNQMFAFLSLGRPEYLQDSDVVSNRFQRRDVYGAWEQYLGLEHSDNIQNTFTANQNRHFEKPVKIYN